VQTQARVFVRPWDTNSVIRNECVGWKDYPKADIRQVYDWQKKKEAQCQLSLDGFTCKLRPFWIYSFVESWVRLYA
jgi:hypothetical protein